MDSFRYKLHIMKTACCKCIIQWCILTVHNLSILSPQPSLYIFILKKLSPKPIYRQVLLWVPAVGNQRSVPCVCSVSAPSVSSWPCHSVPSSWHLAPFIQAVHTTLHPAALPALLPYPVVGIALFVHHQDGPLALTLCVEGAVNISIKVFLQTSFIS